MCSKALRILHFSILIDVCKRNPQVSLVKLYASNRAVLKMRYSPTTKQQFLPPQFPYVWNPMEGLTQRKGWPNPNMLLLKYEGRLLPSITRKAFWPKYFPGRASSSLCPVGWLRSYHIILMQLNPGIQNASSSHYQPFSSQKERL